MIEIMVYAKEVRDSVVPEWLGELRGVGLECGIHPAFSFDGHSGFLPFKVRMPRCPLHDYRDVDLLSGFELDVHDYAYIPDKPGQGQAAKLPVLTELFKEDQSEQPGHGAVLEEISGLLRMMKKELTLRIGTRDTLEIILAWYAAAFFTRIFEGLLYEPFAGKYFNAEEARALARDMDESFKNNVPASAWTLHKFKGWK